MHPSLSCDRSWLLIVRLASVFRFGPGDSPILKCQSMKALKSYFIVQPTTMTWPIVDGEERSDASNSGKTWKSKHGRSSSLDSRSFIHVLPSSSPLSNDTWSYIYRQPIRIFFQGVYISNGSVWEFYIIQTVWCILCRSFTQSFMQFNQSINAVYQKYQITKPAPSIDNYVRSIKGYDLYS